METDKKKQTRKTNHSQINSVDLIEKVVHHSSRSLSILLGWGQKKSFKDCLKEPLKDLNKLQYLGVACPAPHPTWSSKVSTGARAANKTRLA